MHLRFLQAVDLRGKRCEVLVLQTNPRKVSDGGGIFRCNQAMDVYAALGIKKDQIEKRQAWQNYVRRVGGFEIPATCRGG